MHCHFRPTVATNTCSRFAFAFVHMSFLTIFDNFLPVVLRVQWTAPPLHHHHVSVCERHRVIIYALKVAVIRNNGDSKATGFDNRVKIVDFPRHI